MRLFPLIILLLLPGVSHDVNAAPGDLPAITQESESTINRDGIAGKQPWLDSLENALGIASEEYRPVVVFFHSPTDGWSARMRAQVFSDEAVKSQLKHYVRVEIAVEDHPQSVRQYMVRNIPSVRILSADGRIQQGRDGFVGAPDMVRLLRSSLNSEFLKKTDPEFKKLVQSLEQNKVGKTEWPNVMISLGQNEKRETLRQLILKLEPFPRSNFVGMLSDTRVAVRLGSLEILEEVSGDDFGFDPWLGTTINPKNTRAIEQWNQWAGKKGGENISKIFSALTEDQIARYIRDMVGDNRERALRAKTMLRSGGKNVAKSLQIFLNQGSDFPPAVTNRVRELFYALTMPSLGGHDPDTLAHRLISGNLDSKLETLTVLKESGRAAIPILTDFLKNPDPLVRETALDALLSAGKSFAIRPVTTHLETEKDNDVIITALRTIGVTKLKEGAPILVEYAASDEEDLAVTALEGLGAISAKSHLNIVIEQLKDERWRVRVAALETIRKLKDEGESKAVRAILNDEDEFVRVAAVQTIAQLEDKSAIPELLKLYKKHEELRGPVVQALISMKQPLPDSLKTDLAEGSPDTILAIIDVVGDSRSKQLSLIEDFTTHADKDVSCATLRQIARYGMNDSHFQQLVVDAIKEGVPEKVAAAIESLHLEKGQFAFWKPPGSAGGDTAPNPLVDRIYDSFLERKSGGNNSSVDPLTQLFSAVDEQLNSSQNETIRGAAALFMAKTGDEQAIATLQQGLQSKSVSQRTKVAQNLRSAPKSTIPVLITLMRDRSPEVRAAASSAMLRRDADSAFLEAFFKEMTRIATTIKPWEVDLDYLNDPIEKGTGKSIANRYAREILENSLDPHLQSFAIASLRYAWKYGDEKLLIPFTTSENPYIRRAAWLAIGRNQKKLIEENALAIADDSSEKVRAVLPFILDREGRYWVHYFDAEHNQRYYDYSSSSFSFRNQKLRFGDQVKEALVKLSNDSAPSVKVESSFLLLASGEKIDPAALEATLSGFPDRDSIRSRVSDYLENNYRKLDRSYRFLTNHIDESDIGSDELKKIYSHFGVNTDGEKDDNLTWEERKTKPSKSSPAPAENNQSGTEAIAGKIELLFFYNPGCDECERVEEILTEMKTVFPRLNIIEHNIRDSASSRLNEALCEKFGVPEKVRMVAPAVFTGDSYLIKNDILPVALGDLIKRSSLAGTSPPGWSSLNAADLASADEAIGNRFSSVGLAVILSAGILDGINPCAFATIILFLSYLQIARHGRRQILMVGAAFISAVFLTYFVLGLGLIEVVSRLRFLKGAGMILNWGLAFFALVIMILSIKDGILCLQGRMGEISLQLPAFLKDRIRKVARTGARQRHFVIAAFLSGIVISVLELACTGQVYLQTINYMVQSGKTSAYAYLLLYNLAFVLPLIIIFALAWFGMRSDALIDFQKKHSAVIKFATAALFLALFVLLIFHARS